MDRVLTPTEARGGLTRRQAADRLGIQREVLRRYERGERQPPASTIERMRVEYALTDEELRGLLAWYAARPKRARAA